MSDSKVKLKSFKGQHKIWALLGQVKLQPVTWQNTAWAFLSVSCLHHYSEKLEGQQDGEEDISASHNSTECFACSELLSYFTTDRHSIQINWVEAHPGYAY